MISNIEKWIDSATRGLASSEVKRIHTDILEHFTDACTAYQAKGDAHAEARALDDLGSPDVANQKYRSIYLTEEDELKIERLLHRSWWTYVYAFGLALAFVVMAINQKTVKAQLAEAGETVYTSLTLMILLWLLAIYEPFIKRVLYQKSPKYGLLWGQVFIVLLAYPFFGSAFTDIQKVFEGKLYLSASLLSIPLVYFWLKAQLPLTLKLLRRLRA